jgi:ribosomal protein S18 acetylase RimI-like enzyme
MDPLIRPIRDEDRPWMREVLAERWGSTRIVSRGRVHEADLLPGWIAELDGDRAGLLTFRRDPGACEIVTLDALVEGRGVGSALLDAMRSDAALHGCRRLWLVTTNDNLRALGFYRARGFTVAAIHEGAVAEARRLKPEIPETGMDGVPIRDEIELEITRRPHARARANAGQPSVRESR